MTTVDTSTAMAQPEPEWSVVVMGVAGTGKSSVAVPLAQQLGAAFLEADEFHPPVNVEKMTAGHPLDDSDREPWLDALVVAVREQHAAGHPVVMTCSALRRRYRDHLRRADPSMVFLHLHGDSQLILQRMQSRDHFMPPILLESQLAALEEPDDDERHAVVDVTAPLADVIEEAAAWASRADRRLSRGRRSPRTVAG